MKKVRVVEELYRACDYCGKELTFPLNNGYANKGGTASYKRPGMGRSTTVSFDFCNGDAATCETDWICAHQQPWFQDPTPVEPS